ncbi:MAG: indole-3-glycerol phosphate synthase TrpC [Solobacterium sp.]|nr:indole-3-glycerol phosphate synthase TrpC [Solobacterium sp.]
MADILEQLAAHARRRVTLAKEKISHEQMKQAAYAMNRDTGFPFYEALAEEGMSFIAECKKASPSKGVIAKDFPYLEIARAYEEAGASCISVLTEPKWFQGSLEYLKEIAADVNIPVLRKDFIVDEYMIYEAKTAGASAVLLICSILTEEQLCDYLQITHELGMSALVEAHDEEEVAKAVNSGAKIIGVNNRNLHDFTVDLNNSIRLRSLVPPDILFVAESGIRTRSDIEILEKGNISGVLIGETLMKAQNKKEMLEELKGKKETV